MALERRVEPGGALAAIKCGLLWVGWPLLLMAGSAGCAASNQVVPAVIKLDSEIWTEPDQLEVGIQGALHSHLRKIRRLKDRPKELHLYLQHDVTVCLLTRWNDSVTRLWVRLAHVPCAKRVGERFSDFQFTLFQNAARRIRQHFAILEETAAAQGGPEKKEDTSED